MCAGVAIITRNVPDALIAEYKLDLLIVTRSEAAERELQFLHRHKRPLLPVWYCGQICVFDWGSRDCRSRLPQTGWCRQESLDAGVWQDLTPEVVEIPANYGFDKGVWYQVTEGIRGIVVRDEVGTARVYMLTQPSTHYYQIMTRNERMPVLVGETI